MVGHFVAGAEGWAAAGVAPATTASAVEMTIARVRLDTEILSRRNVLSSRTYPELRRMVRQAMAIITFQGA
ncbi:hypothetical protein Aab01nite_38010 [Paractinoplanes abujensis]|nr:hypothetical protein Aab01nite_38010 [Actinoplanes abujensis]